MGEMTEHKRNDSEVKNGTVQEQEQVFMNMKKVNRNTMADNDVVNMERVKYIMEMLIA